MLEHIQLGQVALVGAVGEVEPGGIHAGLDQLADHLRVGNGGAEGADHFGLSQSSYLQTM